MFSETHLAANLAALERAQGHVPVLRSIDQATTRAVPDARYGLTLELRADNGDWTPLDGAAPEEAALAALPDAEPAHIVAAGLGLGFVVDAIERRRWRTGVVAIETDPGVAMLFLARRDWTGWFDSGRLRLLVGPGFSGATACAAAIDGRQAPPILVHPTLAALRPHESAAAVAVARRLVDGAAANAEARRKFAGRYLLQTLANVPAIARAADVRALGDAFPGVPAVVVAAGPSLDDNLPGLRRYRDRAVVIAADTALRPLTAAGMPPDVVVAVDPSELNARHVTGVGAAGGVCLAAEGSVHPSALEAFRGRTFVFRVSDHEPWPWLRRFGVDCAVLRAWGSVAITAFDLARRLGCDPIVFAGQDLAFTGGRPYCSHTLYDELWTAMIRDHGCTWPQLMNEYFSRQSLVIAADLNGQAARTTPSLIAFRDALVEQAAASGRTVVNATGAGIFGGTGVALRSLDSVFGTRPAVRDVAARLRRALGAGAMHPQPLRDEPGLSARFQEFTGGTLDASAIRAALEALLSDQMVSHESA